MDALEPQLRQLLEAHSQHFKLTDNGKIECTLNGHTLPARLDAVSAFIQGAKFQKLSKRQAAEQALQKYEPFIVQSNNFPLMLYCALTGQLIDKSVEAVKKHMKGKKFQRAKDRFAADELELKPEPTLESFGIKVDAAAAAGAGKQQQQQQKKDAAGAANGAAAAAGSDDEGGFWVPEGVDTGSGSEEDEDEEDTGSDGDDDAAGSSGEGGDEAMDTLEAGQPQQQQQPGGTSRDRQGDDPMEEDVSDAAAGAAASGSSRKGSRKAGSKAAAASKAAKPKQGGKAQNGAAVVGAAKKQRNAQRPSAAKKARR